MTRNSKGCCLASSLKMRFKHPTGVTESIHNSPTMVQECRPCLKKRDDCRNIFSNWKHKFPLEGCPVVPIGSNSTKAVWRITGASLNAASSRERWEFPLWLLCSRCPWLVISSSAFKALNLTGWVRIQLKKKRLTEEQHFFHCSNFALLRAF